MSTVNGTKGDLICDQRIYAEVLEQDSFTYRVKKVMKEI